ncbi:MAG: MBL fold metallo-hydrolase [bacterium]|nr:MBL fold metallo-hydrolase [Candidatus Margulisiibacteriota bacterium]
MAKDKLTIKICYEDRAVSKKFKPGWGFAALVEYAGHSILFDTGDKPKVLLHNMKQLKVNPAKIGAVFISHDHWDHTGGIEIINKNLIGAKRFSKLFPHFYSTGLMGKKIPEQAMVVETAKGLVVLCGCSHPGIVKMLKKVKKKLAKEVLLVIGGFHLYKSNEKEISRIIKDIKRLGVKKVAPCHCAGDNAIKMFAEEFKERFLKVGVGSCLSF